MAATAFVRARIDGTLKDEAAAVLADMGLTVSDVVRIALTKIAKEKVLPFEMRVPNATTRLAIAELESGKTVQFSSVDDLMADLNADD